MVFRALEGRAEPDSAVGSPCPSRARLSLGDTHSGGRVHWPERASGLTPGFGIDVQEPVDNGGLVEPV